MSITILEALQNAKYNINNPSHVIQFEIGKRQLINAVSLLEKGFNLEENFDYILEEYGSIENVPDKLKERT